MLKKDSVLKKNKDFREIFNGHDFTRNNFFYLIKNPNNLNKSRFGFIVSSRVSKKASERNLIKRRLRAIIKKYLKDVKPGLDVAIGVYPGVLNKDYKTMEEKMAELIRKSQLFI